MPKYFISDYMKNVMHFYTSAIFSWDRRLNFHFVSLEGN